MKNKSTNQTEKISKSSRIPAPKYSTKKPLPISTTDTNTIPTIKPTNNTTANPNTRIVHRDRHKLLDIDSTDSNSENEEEEYHPQPEEMEEYSDQEGNMNHAEMDNNYEDDLDDLFYFVYGTRVGQPGK